MIQGVENIQSNSFNLGALDNPQFSIDFILSKVRFHHPILPKSSLGSWKPPGIRVQPSRDQPSSSSAAESRCRRSAPVRPAQPASLASKQPSLDRAASQCSANVPKLYPKRPQDARTIK